MLGLTTVLRSAKDAYYDVVLHPWVLSSPDDIAAFRGGCVCKITKIF